MSEGLHHGGAVDSAAARTGIPRERWLDLSTGINPWPYPRPAVADELWQRLPDAGLDRDLRTAAARAYRVADPDLVVAAPGSQALIQWLPRLVPASRVAVVAPTYGEHAACWAAAGHAVETIAEAEVDDVACDVLVITNPNNPDGRRMAPERVLAVLDRRDGRAPLVVVDEAFADVAPEVSLAPWAGRPGLVVLRSFGKFFGLAGLRLGFALADPAMATALRRALGPWAVAGPAAAVAVTALGDDAWIAATRSRLASRSRDLDALLTAHGLPPVGGTDLFRLVEHPQASALFDHLAAAAILVRAFPERPDRLRFGLPGDDAEWARLAEALAAWRDRARSAAE